MNNFQAAFVLVPLREMWQAMDKDLLMPDAESRLAWVGLVDWFHRQTGCDDNRVANAFAAELHKLGCFFDRDHMGKIMIRVPREKVYGGQKTIASRTGG